MQTIERLWSKAPDKHLALLDYRTTPLESVGLSPAQLLMGRRPRNKLPAARELLTPMAYDALEVKRLLDKTKDTQKFYYDRKRAANPRPALQPGDEVRMAPYPGHRTWTPGVILQPHCTPRSYVVESGGRQFRHTRQHLRTSTPTANWSRHEVVNEPWPELPDPAPVTPMRPPAHPEPRPSPPRERLRSVQAQPDQSGELHTTRRGRVVKPPNRLNL